MASCLGQMVSLAQLNLIPTPAPKGAARLLAPRCFFRLAVKCRHLLLLTSQHHPTAPPWGHWKSYIIFVVKMKCCSSVWKQPPIAVMRHVQATNC